METIIKALAGGAAEDVDDGFMIGDDEEGYHDGFMPLNDTHESDDDDGGGDGGGEMQLLAASSSSREQVLNAAATYCSSGCNYWGGESEAKSMGVCLPPQWQAAALPWGPFGALNADTSDTDAGHIPSKLLYRKTSFSCNDLQKMRTDEERRAALEQGLTARALPPSAGDDGSAAALGETRETQSERKPQKGDRNRSLSPGAGAGGGGGGDGGGGFGRTTSVPGLLGGGWGGFRRLNLTPGISRAGGGGGFGVMHPASRAAEDAFAAAAALDEDDPDRKQRVLFCCHGSRGDVQPLVALALGMKEKGTYDVAFWTVKPVDEFVKRQGIECYVHDLDTDDLMRRSMVKVNQSPERLGKALGFFKAVAEIMLEPDIAPKIDAIPSALLAAHVDYKPDLTITSHCMPAISCAEYLHIPVVYIALQPMYPTRHFPPWAFRSTNFAPNMQWMNKPLGQLFMSIYENQTYLKGVKKCRQLANLPVRRFSDGTPVYNLRFVPTVNGVSQALVPQPSDYPKWQRICGFLMMEDGREDIWSAPEELMQFLDSGSDPVYVGFGSMCGEEEFQTQLTRVSLTALMRSGQRGILLGGWAGMTRRRLDPVADAAVVAYCEANVYELPACPHTWLFPRCAAVVHHGGAGTLAVGLRSGCPTIVCPFIFDQEYFGGLVVNNNCGKMTTPARTLGTEELAAAITQVMTDPEIRANATRVAEDLRRENGVRNGIEFIEEVVQSFPYPWTIRLPRFRRDEPAWTDGEFAHYFDNSDLLDSAN